MKDTGENIQEIQLILTEGWGKGIKKNPGGISRNLSPGLRTKYLK